MKPSSLMDSPGAVVRVGAVVALKPMELAKSRLGSLAAPLRRRIAWTMAVDTLSALSAAVDSVLVVSDQASLESRLRRLGLAVTVVAEPGRVGMNGSLTHGEQALRELGCGSVLACVGDLPALRPGSVRRVLEASPPRGRTFVADASGVGTTMLLASDAPLEPHFQGRSAAAHRTSGALALTAEMLGGPVADARRDVDTEVDLVDAVHLGLGPATAAVIDPATGTPGQYDVITMTDQRNADGAQIAITSRGYRIAVPPTAFEDALRAVRTGQRLHAATAGDHVLSAWL
jgi:2-phospho-L-lactate guanylyltransferase